MDKKLSVDARSPFTLLQQPRPIRNMWKVVNDVTTFFDDEKNVLPIPHLPDPKKPETGFLLAA
jgi:hypothetical protein